MATQLAERPSRVERINSAGDSRVGRFTNSAGDTVYGSYDRYSYLKEKGLDQLGKAKSSINKVGNVRNTTKNILKKRITLNFICMLIVSGTLDLVGFFATIIPGVGILLSIIYNVIFIPWFYFSGIKFNMKKIGSMGTTSILEYIPIIGNLPLMTVNTIYSYYSE
jgi:hypothetical protein